MRGRIDFDRHRRWRECERQTFRIGAVRFFFRGEVRGRQGRLAAHLRRVGRSPALGLALALGALPQAEVMIMRPAVVSPKLSAADGDDVGLGLARYARRAA